MTSKQLVVSDAGNKVCTTRESRSKAPELLGVNLGWDSLERHLHGVL